MSIRNKLIIYTVASFFIVLIVVAVAIDYILTDLYKENAVAELNQSYQNFNHELEAIEADILNQTLQISIDNSVIALTNMVNRYENKENYQALIFDNDKKRIASYLLKSIALTNSEQAVIYNIHGNLVAYAINNKKQKEAGFLSYKKGLAVNVKQLNSNGWVTGSLPESIDIRTQPLNINISFLTYSGKINYLPQTEKFIIENSRVIKYHQPNGRLSLLGVVKVNKALDHAFFNELSKNSQTEVSLLLHSGYLLNQKNNLLPIAEMEKKSSLHRSSSSLSRSLLTNNNYYIHSVVWPTEFGNSYLLVSSSRSDLILALNKTRKILIISFSIIAMLAIMFGVFWLNKLISIPLNALAEQAKTMSANRLPTFPVSKANDEISLLGNVLNEMVAAISSREKELVENESQLSHTQALAKIGGWKMDHENNVMKFTDEIYNILGLSKNESTANQKLFSNCVHPDDIAKVEEAFNEHMSLHTPYQLTHRLLMKDGTTKTVYVYSETVFNEKGKALKTKGIVQDITEQTIKDEQLSRTQKMNALGKLTGGIAHDFNNMLGVIIGFSELLQGSKLNKDEKTSRYIYEITQAAQRAAKLTSKLLSFSSNKLFASNLEANINSILRGEQHMLEKTLTVRIQLKFKLENNLWPVSLDKGELEDAIVNISINAMHAMPNNGVLTMSTHNVRLNDIEVKSMNIAAGDYVKLSIADTGTGMSRQTIQRIFEPFYSTKAEKGTGLGMSQVYGFVQRSNGDIHIYSELGHGSKITIYFPRYISDTSKLAEEKQVEHIEDLTGSATILIVDDEDALRSLVEEILSSKGYDVLSANNAETALQLLKNTNVDLVLSDVIMPNVDGYQLSKMIKHLYPNIKIQMVSGFSDIQDSEVKKSELYKNCLYKPYSSKELLLRVKELLLES